MLRQRGVPWAPPHFVRATGSACQKRAQGGDENGGRGRLGREHAGARVGRDACPPPNSILASLPLSIDLEEEEASRPWSSGPQGYSLDPADCCTWLCDDESAPPASKLNLNFEMPALLEVRLVGSGWKEAAGSRLRLLEGRVGGRGDDGAVDGRARRRGRRGLRLDCAM